MAIRKQRSISDAQVTRSPSRLPWTNRLANTGADAPPFQGTRLDARRPRPRLIIFRLVSGIPSAWASVRQIALIITMRLPPGSRQSVTWRARCFRVLIRRCSDPAEHPRPQSSDPRCARTVPRSSAAGPGTADVLDMDRRDGARHVRSDDRSQRVDDDRGLGSGHMPFNVIRYTVGT